MVGDWAMPWNAKADARRLGPGPLKSDFWASDPVLLTRGVRGCYVYFMDPSTRDFFLGRKESHRLGLVRRAAETPGGSEMSKLIAPAGRG